jgi:hypothetical protein
MGLLISSDPEARRLRIRVSQISFLLARRSNYRIFVLLKKVPCWGSSSALGPVYLKT